MDQMTFTEQEVKDLTEFANLIIQKARFDMNPKEIFEFAEKYKKFVAHIKKCEDHIMELKAVTEKPKDNKK